MAFEAAVVVTENPTGGGPADHTGFGFQPKVIIIFTTASDSGSPGAHASGMIGAAVSSTSRFAYQAISEDADAGWDKLGQHENDHCIAVRGVTGTDFIEADMDSFISDGVTLDWTTTNATQRDIGILGLGGDDLTNVAILEFTTPTSTGTQGYTSVGFQPDAVIIVCTGITTAANAQQDDDTSYSVGFAVDGSNERAVTGASEASTDGFEYSGHAGSVLHMVDHDGTVLNTSKLSAYDADGFTLNCTATDGSAYRCYAICLKGGNYVVREESTPATATTFGETTFGFTPNAVMTIGAQQDVTGDTADRFWTMGMASGVNGANHYGFWNGSEDQPTTDSVADRDAEDDELVLHYSEGTPTLLEEVEVDSFDPDGITFEATTADSTTYLFSLLCFGNEQSGVPLFDHHYRQLRGA